MSTKFFTPALVCVLLFVQPLILTAQTFVVQADWNAVKNVAAKSKLRVETKNGDRANGIVGDVSDSTLVLTQKGKTASFNRTDVRRIYVLKSGSRVKTTLIGAGAGAGAGAGVAAII